MNRNDFFHVASHLSNWSDTLRNQVESSLTQAEDSLCRNHGVNGLVSPASEPIVQLLVRSIAQRIDEVLYAYDWLCDVIDLPPRYNPDFRAPDLGGGSFDWPSDAPGQRPT